MFEREEYESGGISRRFSTQEFTYCQEFESLLLVGFDDEGQGGDGLVLRVHQDHIAFVDILCRTGDEQGNVGVSPIDRILGP